MIRGFYNGVNGVKTQSFGIDLVSNNISNINNVGFRASIPEFKTIFYQGSNQAGFSPVHSQVGLSATGLSSAVDMKQGAFKNTDNTFDMAIQGRGFFGISDASGNMSYTRNGEFFVDVNGDLVDRSGRYLQGSVGKFSQIPVSQSAREKLSNSTSGKMANLTNAPTINAQDDVKISQTSTKINLPDMIYLPPTATTMVSFRGNLDSTLQTQKMSVNLGNDNLNPPLINQAQGTLSLSGSVQKGAKFHNPNLGDEVSFEIVDKNGQKLVASAFLDENKNFKLENFNVRDLDLSEPLTINSKIFTTQEVANKDEFLTEIYAADGSVNNLKLNFKKKIPTFINGISWDVDASLFSKSGGLLSQGKGNISFNTKGILASNTLPLIDNKGTPLSIDFGRIYDPNSQDTSYDGMVSNANGERNLRATKDGEAEGLLKVYDMGDDGRIMATFDNGKQAVVARIPLYQFQNEQGLSKNGDNSYQATINSGKAVFFTENGEYYSGGKIKNQTLEMSNVSLASSLTELIAMQKAYDASAKSITTSDQMIQRAINMKK